VEGLSAGAVSVRRLCQQVKKGLPFTFRYERNLSGISDVPVTITNSNVTADEAFSLVAQHLPEPWQIAALPGYVIMYPDSPHSYLSARRYYRGTKVIDVTPVFDDPGEIEEVSTSEGDDEAE
jgi:hypothetical protein